MSSPLREAEGTAREFVNNASLGAFAVNWIPGSTVATCAIDWLMVTKVAEIFRVESYDRERFLGTLAGAVSVKASTELLSLLPGVGWFAKGAMAMAITKCAGEATIEYFRQRSPLAVELEADSQAIGGKKFQRPQ
jgi:hypothetical protein